MIPKTKTVESEGIPATPVIEADKIPTTPITDDGGGGGGGDLPPNIFAETVWIDGNLASDGTITTPSSTYNTKVCEAFIPVENGFDYLFTLQTEDDGPQVFYIANYNSPFVSGFIDRTIIAGGSGVDYETKLFTAKSDYIRVACSTHGRTTLSVIKVDSSTITNYTELN